MFSILLVLMASGFKTYQTVCFKYIQLAACQPYFNKPVYKKVKGEREVLGPSTKSVFYLMESYALQVFFLFFFLQLKGTMECNRISFKYSH